MKVTRENKLNKLSIVIPVYNEEKYISQVVEKVLRKRVRGFRYKEVVVVDDGSSDGTRDRLRILEKRFGKRIKIFYKKKNEGKGAALKLGFSKTTGDVVIIQDADLEYSPDDYDILLEPFLKYGADVVYGSRFSFYKPRRILYFWHSLANKMLTLFSNMFTNLNLTDMETGFKCFRGDLIRYIAPEIKSKRFGFEPEITARISRIKGVKIFEVGISYEGRTYEEGKKIGWKDGVRAIWEILKFNLFD